MELNMETFVNLMQDYIQKSKTGGSSYDIVAPYGTNAHMTWSQWKKKRADGFFSQAQVKETSLTPFSNTLYGCTGLFGICGPDEIIGLTMGDDPLVEWLGFVPDTICERFIKGWAYTDIRGTAAGSVEGNVYGAACDDPPTTEKGVFEYFIGDFGTLRACGEALDVSNLPVRKCDKQPTYTIPIEGVGPIRIDNDLDLESITATQAVKHELSRLLITGDKSVTGQFDGLANLVKTGYVSINGELITAIDSIVFDWDDDYMTGLVNGHGSIITKIRDIFRQIMWRINQTGMGRPAEGDIALVMPSWLAWQLLDEWAVWSFVEQVNNNQVVYRDYMDVRAMRDKFSGGLFGGGYITIDNYNIHIIPHDWMALDQDAPKFIGDIYFLTRRIGNRRVLQGQYVPVDQGASAVNALAGYSYFNTEMMQGGRLLRWLKYDNACVKPCVLTRPRLYLETPWASAVIQNVAIAPQFAPISLDPRSNYYLEQNRVSAVPHTQYFYQEGVGWFS